MPGCYGMEMRRSAECTGTIQPPYYVTCVPTRAANHPSVFTITGLLLVERAYKGFHIKDTIKTLCLRGANPTCRDISRTDSVTSL